MVMLVAPCGVLPKANWFLVMPPEPAVPSPRVIDVPPDRVKVPECWKFRLLATWAPLIEIAVLPLPLVAEGPATK